MKIDFVSDVACPWCAVGLNALEQALRQLPELEVQLNFHPFELNPDMPVEGEDALEHLGRKYGMTHEQLLASREGLRQRGAAVGFSFGPRSRVWNTFDAHRLLYWAGIEGFQRDLKHALLVAYHTRDENPSDPVLLQRIVAALGQDEERAGAILGSDEFADEVRELEGFWLQQGIRSVPSVVVNDRHLIQGGQPPEVFEQALRELAAQA